ncbi:MAG: site-2 protease family protein [Anaerolineales bacterium]
MGSSLRLFSVRGIDVKVHITFPLILVWAAIQFGWLTGNGLEGAVFGVIVTLLLFAVVVLHELGHSFTALEFDVPIQQIVLLPIGGVSQMGKMPEKPGQELLVAVAGPAVNFVLGIALAAVALFLNISLAPSEMIRSLQGMGSLTFDGIFRYLFVTNIFLGVFNLLPAFPMDGGRVLRSLLATRMSRPRATNIAVWVGQTFAWLMGLWGFLGGGFFLVLIAIFIYLGAGQEGQQTRLRSVLADLRVRNAYSRQAATLAPTDTLQRAVDLMLSSFQASFPVCDDERLVGFLPQKRLVEMLHSQGPQTPIHQAMLTEFDRADVDDGLFDVQQQLAQGNQDAMPVSDGDRFLGLITQQDIAEIYQLASSEPGLIGSIRST